jgi:hypothetical protein
MALYLVESILAKEKRDKNIFEETIHSLSELAGTKESTLVEVQVSSDFTRAFLVMESTSQAVIREVFSNSNLSVTLVKPVRIVGASLDDIRQKEAKVRYLVEWNLPEGLTMDAYIERKKKSSVHYAEVPEVTFQRTYVCEDMTKCLCFYDGPDEEAIFKARKAVGAPVDAITETVSVATPAKTTTK